MTDRSLDDFLLHMWEEYQQGNSTPLFRGRRVLDNLGVPHDQLMAAALRLKARVAPNEPLHQTVTVEVVNG